MMEHQPATYSTMIMRGELYIPARTCSVRKERVILH